MAIHNGKNRAYDYLRKKSQTGTVHRGDPVDPARLVQETDVETMHGSSPDDPAEQTIGEGIEELVWEAARDIDTKGFQVWKLRRRGLHLKAVSNALDRNYNTVRQQARRFRNALAEELDDRYGLNDMV